MPIDEDTLKRRYREFVDLLPLTLSIAGLPASHGAINFSPDQMELRAHTVSQAYKLSRQMLREALGA